MSTFTSTPSLGAWWDTYKEKTQLRPETLESFRRAVDALYSEESRSMLTFIQESREELRDTHGEIAKEQEVLRDTSDLLASKRMYGDLDELEDNFHKMNAVDEYLKRRNNGDIGGLGILSFEGEVKSHKKEKKKSKGKHGDRHRSGRNSRSDTLSSRADSHGGELFGTENELIMEQSSKKDNKPKKQKKDKERGLDAIEEEREKVKEKKHKRGEQAEGEKANE